MRSFFPSAAAYARHVWMTARPVLMVERRLRSVCSRPLKRIVALWFLDEVVIDEQDDLAPERSLIDRLDNRPLAAGGLGHRVLDAIEVRQLLRFAVFLDFEVVSGQPGDRPAMVVCDCHVD